MAAAKPAPLNVTLPLAPERYDHDDEQRTRRLIEQSFQKIIPSQPTISITGAKGGNTAVASIVALLVQLGLGVDNTT